MNIIWLKIVAIFEAIVALVSPTVSPTIIPEPIITPPALIEQAEAPAGELVLLTPTIQKQIEELKQIIISHTPEPTPTPQIIYIPIPIPTPTPTPVPVDHLPSFKAIYFDSNEFSVGQFIGADCDRPCIKVNTPHETKVRIIYIAQRRSSADLEDTGTSQYSNEFKEVHLFPIKEAGLMSERVYNFYVEATNHDGIILKVKFDFQGFTWKMP